MGLDRVKLAEYLKTCSDIGDEPDVLLSDRDGIVYLLDNCEITLNEENTFFVRVNCENMRYLLDSPRRNKLSGEHSAAGLRPGMDALAFTGDADYGHTSTDWEAVLILGISGLRDRLIAYREKFEGDEKRTRFYSACIDVYDAAIRFMQRAADKAEECGKASMAHGLLKLCSGTPTNLFEALQTILVYYALQHIFDGTNLRTLGRLDRTLYHYYIKEEKESAERMLREFLIEIDSYKVLANIPFALGGSDDTGKSLFNELSYSLLDAYRTVPTSNVKLHLLCNKDTPDNILRLAMLCVRENRNSIVFMSEEKIIESLEKLGAEHSDAVDYHVVGCYECGARNELTCSCNARISIPKALETALNGGADMLTGKMIGLPNNGGFESFDELFREFRRQLLHFARQAMEATDVIERHNPKIHSSPVLSSTYESALKRGADLYCGYGAEYNNSSVNALGLGTAVDSLAAIRKLVFEEKVLTLERLVEILKSDWEGCEPLRLRIKNKYPKYGTGDKKTDLLAKQIIDILGKAIDGRPNEKGGVYRLGTFSIDWRWAFGKACAASADGRHSGESLSQNTSASFGADREGATAHLISAASIDASLTPNGSIADIDLHSSAAAGDNGIYALITSLRTYFSLGGFAVHYNILDTKVLEAARARPEDYPNLQVRLCGWNVLFSSLSDREKDEFIARSKKDG